MKRKKKFKKVVEYIEDDERNASFNVKTKSQKIIMIIFFILFFPLTAIISWFLEFTSLISIKREVHWEEVFAVE